MNESEAVLDDPTHAPVNVRDFAMLQQQVDTHLNEYRNDKEQENIRWHNMFTAQKDNTAAIYEQNRLQQVSQAESVEAMKALTSSTQEIADSTKDIIETWAVANGVIKFAVIMGKFAKWLTAIGAAVGGTVYFFNR